MKKARKQIMNMVGTTIVGGAGATALGKIGGTAATSGATGIANATKMMPTMGTIYGTGMLLGQVAKFKRRK